MKMVGEWQGREIAIPANVTFKTLGRDTLCYDLLDKPFKILTYIDSTGCTSCQFGLHAWRGIIQLCRQQQLDVGFIFVVHSGDFRHFDADVLLYSFDYPIVYDYHDDFDKLNHFSPAPYRTFLLDKENKVQLIGSPIGNPQVWDLYLETIKTNLF